MHRKSLRHLLGTLCTAALIPACPSDDVATFEDTDASTGNGTTAAVTDSVGESGLTTTSEGGSTTTATESTGTPTCTDPMSLFADPSFELGERTPWGFSSSAAENNMPLCNSECASMISAADGEWFVWIGGFDTADVGGVSQEVEIPAQDAMTMTFSLWLAAGPAPQLAQVLIDGNVAFEATDADAETYAAWTDVEVDISAYADGNAHQFDFVGAIPGQGGVLYDNVRFFGCGGGAVTAGDTVDPPSTTSAGTDTDGGTGFDTNGMLAMCDGVIDTMGGLPLVIEGSNMGATNEVRGSCLAESAGASGPEYVYEFTAPAAGIYTFDTLDSSGIDDTVLYLYDGCMDGTEIACNDDAGPGYLSRVTQQLTEGQVVAVVVDGFSDTAVGDFTLTIRQMVCDAPTDLGSTAPVTDVPGTSIRAGNDSFGSCGGDEGEDRSFSWTAPSDALYTFDTIGSEFATVIYAFTGTCGDPSGEIGCNSNSALSRFTAAVGAGQEVIVVVDDADPDDGFEGAFNLSITEAGALVGDCCTVDDSAGCESAAVTQCVCADIPECCSDTWSEACAGWAASNCGATGSTCDPVPGGSCCTAVNDMAGCDVPSIQECMCAIDDFCCTDAWDSSCVQQAQTFCFAQCG